ncbi:MAG: DUF1330 domain-containing protein [Sphingomonadaceae bacterium]|nr:DUF1330 domain-containing protein [Sphingomonadaceae bacterium]
MSLLFLAAAATATLPVELCDNKPVYMVVAGPTYDRARMQAYAKAIADSKLYQKLGGYYVNAPVPVATFEGEPAKGHATLIVRFPCLANAKAFWYSRTYQETIKPLRLNPSSGDYLVTVYPEIPVRSDMAGKVGDNRYETNFSPDGIEQVSAP